MIDNDCGLRVSGEPVKRHIVRVELDVEVAKRPTAADARLASEVMLHEALTNKAFAHYWMVRLLGRPNAKQAAQIETQDLGTYNAGPRVVGRPNANRATVAPDES